MPNVIYPGKIYPPGPGRTALHCVDCGIEKGPMMCPPCAERLAEDIVEHISAKNDKPTLNLYEVEIEPVETHHTRGDWKYVMVLSTNEKSAADSALDILGLADHRKFLTWTVNECEGPFVKGSILSVKTIPVI